VQHERVAKRRTTPGSLDTLRHPENDEQAGYEPPATQEPVGVELEARDLWVAVARLPYKEAVALQDLACGVPLHETADGLRAAAPAVLELRERGLLKLREAIGEGRE